MKFYKIPVHTIAPSKIFESRLHSNKMSYRYYPSWSTDTLVLFHGLVSSSIYLSQLAHRIAERKIAQVLVPDWRGHGDDTRDLKWDKETDILQDFEEILIHLKTKTAVQRISALGHSFGAQWLLKISKQVPFKQFYFVSPFLKKSQLISGWYEEKNKTIDITWPEGPRTGKERFSYPTEFLKIFEPQPPLVLNGNTNLFEAGRDEILMPLGDELTDSQIIFPEATHMGIVSEKMYIDQICDFIEKTI